MTTTQPLISRIHELAGPEVAAAIAAEFGGTTVYVRPPPKMHRVPPKFRISGTFRDDAGTMRDSLETVGVAIVGMAFGASDLVVEIETRGLGQGVLERLQDVMSSTGIKVIAMQGVQA